jgi:hypothetical protein
MMHPEIIWKDVVGYEGLYKVSNTGDVLSIKRKGNWRGDHLMVKTNDGRGYPQVCLCKNGKNKSVKVYKIVAKAFIPNPHGYKEINHIDENKWNCRADNLEWCTRLYNVRYGTRTQKTSTKVAMFTKDGKYIQSFNSMREACRICGFPCVGNIARAVKGKRCTAYGYVWKEVI